MPPLNNNVVPLAFLRTGENEHATYRGTVVGSLGVQDVKLYWMRSINVQSSKPLIFISFRMFILADTEERCVLVTVYYIDISTSVSLGDIVEIPRPVYRVMEIEWQKEVRFYDWCHVLFWIHVVIDDSRNSPFRHYVLIRQDIWRSTEKIGQWILMHRRRSHWKSNSKIWLDFVLALVCYSIALCVDFVFCVFT